MKFHKFNRFSKAIVEWRTDPADIFHIRNGPNGFVRLKFAHCSWGLCCVAGGNCLVLMNDAVAWEVRTPPGAPPFINECASSDTHVAYIARNGDIWMYDAIEWARRAPVPGRAWRIYGDPICLKFDVIAVTGCCRRCGTESVTVFEIRPLGNMHISTNTAFS